MRKDEIVSLNNIVINLKATNREMAIHELAARLNENGYISDINEFSENVLKREAYTTTGIGNGIAIPHGKSPVVIKSTVIFGRTENDLEWYSLDGKPVNNIFMMAIKAGDSADVHLHQLAKLSEKMMDDNFITKLKQATTNNELLKIINGDV